MEESKIVKEFVTEYDVVEHVNNFSLYTGIDRNEVVLFISPELSMELCGSRDAVELFGIKTIVADGLDGRFYVGVN